VIKNPNDDAEVIAERSWVVLNPGDASATTEERSARQAQEAMPLRDRPVTELNLLPPEQKENIWSRFANEHPELEGKGNGFVKSVFARWIWSYPEYGSIATTLFPKGT
jgi:hypothetical protein